MMSADEWEELCQVAPPEPEPAPARVVVLPSKYSHDGFEGPGIVVDRRGNDVLVDLSGTLVWIPGHRVEPA